MRAGKLRHDGGRAWQREKRAACFVEGSVGAQRAGRAWKRSERGAGRGRGSGRGGGCSGQGGCAFSPPFERSPPQQFGRLRGPTPVPRRTSAAFRHTVSILGARGVPGEIAERRGAERSPSPERRPPAGTPLPPRVPHIAHVTGALADLLDDPPAAHAAQAQWAGYSWWCATTADDRNACELRDPGCVLRHGAAPCL